MYRQSDWCLFVCAVFVCAVGHLYEQSEICMSSVAFVWAAYHLHGQSDI